MMKRMTAAVFAVLCLILLIPNVAYAIHSEPSTLTVIMTYDEIPLEGSNVAVCLVADARMENGLVFFDATPAFSGVETDFVNLTTEKNIILASRLNAYAFANNIARSAKVTDKRGKAVFANLSAGLYLVAQMDGDQSQYIIAPYLVMVPNADPLVRNSWDHAVTSYPKTEPVKRDISVHVYKLWKGTNSPPSSIQVQLYRNGSPYGDLVSLNAGNDWAYSWGALNPNDKWWVDEIVVPAGYIKSVSGDMRNGFIITNSKTDPKMPDEPEKPGKSFVPPKTEDASNMQLWIVLIAASFLGLLTVLCALNAKRLARIFTRKQPPCEGEPH